MHRRPAAFRLPARLPVLLPALLLAVAAGAAPVRLPASACGAERLFSGGFEHAGADPSAGRGGAFPGDATRSVSVAGLGTRAYHLHVPPAYRPGQSVPLLVALHGAAGAGGADTAARAVRSHWSTTADRGGFLVLAPVASGAQGGWSPDADGAWLAAAMDDIAAAYDVDRSRMLLWGFSAGAHWGHALVLDNPGAFAGFAASAGALQAYACDAAGAPGCSSLLAGQPWPTPLVLRVGREDPLRPYVAADRARFLAHGWTEPGLLDHAEFAGGHAYATAHLDQAWAHLCRFALQP